MFVWARYISVKDPDGQTHPASKCPKAKSLKEKPRLLVPVTHFSTLDVKALFSGVQGQPRQKTSSSSVWATKVLASETNTKAAFSRYGMAED